MAEKPGQQERPPLCWGCKNTNRFDCSWFNPDNPQPVPGWVAELIPKHRMEETYLVKECPKFEPEPPRKAPTPTPPAADDYVPGVYKHTTEYGTYWVARFQRGHRRYYLGHYSSREEAVAAIRAAEAAIKRGEEPPRKAPQPKETKPKASPAKEKAAPRGCPGVRPHQGRWMARITHKGREHYLGWFKTEAEAIAARKAAEEAIKRGEEPCKK